ncbi:MAG: hypothetical protein LBP25_01265 [Tannerellaceae bacterium]|jgi:hypothetical protein|nr:hypothetical protein [Tannerellaceae bacterium]
MRKIASHSIFWKQLYPLSYMELTEEGIFLGIYPLQGETASTEFYDGLLVPVPEGTLLSSPFTPEQIRRSGITERVSTGDKIYLYRLHGGIMHRLL